jgi:large subunit ribosomal protein L17
MRHRYGYSKLSKPTDQRLAMLRSLAVALFKSRRIETTEARAKQLRRFVDRIITLIKKGDLQSRRKVISQLKNEKELVQGLYKNVAQFKANSGHTRIIRSSLRRGDAAQMALIELV